MHTAFELKKRMFDVRAGGASQDTFEFLDWGPLDRLGVVIDRPVGALGAGLLILLCANAFYDVPGKKRRMKPIYPEIYLFHAGGPWGSFITFDFWPDHKEVMVPADSREILRAVNNRGITHLAVPDRQPRNVVHRFKESEAAADRLKRCWTYDPSGSIAHPNVTIGSSELHLLSNYDGVLDLDVFMAGLKDQPNSIPLRLRAPDGDENRLSYEAVAPRIAELRKNSPEHAAAVARVAEARRAGHWTEGYGVASVDEVLRLL